MKLRHLALLILLTLTAPWVKDTIVYAAQVKSTYDSVKQIQNSNGFNALAKRISSHVKK